MIESTRTTATEATFAYRGATYTAFGSFSRPGSGRSHEDDGCVIDRDGVRVTDASRSLRRKAKEAILAQMDADRAADSDA